MTVDVLKQKVAKFKEFDKADVVYWTFNDTPVNLLNIRDSLVHVGKVLEEDLENECYVGRIGVGKHGIHKPIVIAVLRGDDVEIAAMDRPGEAGKKAAQEAIEILEDALRGNRRPFRRRRMGFRLGLFVILVAAIAAIFSHQYLLPHLVLPTQEATGKYNDAVEAFNNVAEEYNEAVSGVAVSNVRGLLASAETLTVQETDYLSVTMAVAGGNSPEIIEADTATVHEMTATLRDDLDIVIAVNNPSEEWVRDRLSVVGHVDLIEAVTKDNDPNGMLGSEGGYTSCTYFTTDLLESDVVEGDGPVAKGTDGGGAIEVYATLTDARARCDYLAGFDGTILYTGSYALVGTMVVRTSCLLTDNSQYALTNDIVEAMTTTGT